LCSCRLIVFIKNPETGKAKTRLAAEIGEQKALEVYRQLLNYTRYITKKVDVQRQVWYSSYIQENDDWAKEGFEQRLQAGDNLGARMKEAFAKALLDDECKRVILIGSDCAELTADILRKAFQDLNCAELTADILRKAFQDLKYHDAVLGPATDGGYYLVGMSKFLPHIFEGKSWSTPTVFEETIRDLESADASCSILPELSDIDNKSDWEKAAKKLEPFS